MVTHIPVTEHSDHLSGNGARTASEPGRLRLRMDFTDPQLAVLTATGDLDMATTPQLTELLWPRLRTTLTTLVLDLGEVSFLGVDAMELLANAHNYATQRGIALCVINSTPTVERALVAGGLNTTLPCFAEVEEARAALVASPETTVHLGAQRTTSPR